MASVADVDQLIEQYQLALDEFMKGNPEPAKQLWSRREDVTLVNLLGPQLVDGSRSLRPRDMQHRISETAR